MKFKQITIIGVGLIGGSIGLAVKKRRLSSKVIGVTRHRRTIRKAVNRKAIDVGTLDAKKSVLGSDLVILATPVDKVLSTLRDIAPNLKKGCIVIDVASIKTAIVRPAERILGKNCYFIGVHPMAGSEQRGIDKAKGSLFIKAPCILTKTKRTDLGALRTVSDFWKALGSRIYILSPDEHDRKISNVSHLPHIAASALSLTAKDSALQFAATGLRDTTRIASSSPELWASILLANKDNVVNDLEDYSRKLEDLKDFIRRGKKAGLQSRLRTAKRKRDRLNLQ